MHAAIQLFPAGRQFLAGAILALVASLAPAQGTDTIVKTDGKVERGVEVTETTLKAIKFKRGGKDGGEVAAQDVAEIRWGGAPDAFAGGLAAMTRNDFAGASKLFGDAVAATERAPLKAEARFQQAKAAALAGDTASAANAAGLLRAWLSEFSDGHRVPEAMLLLGRALRLGGMAGDGATALKELDDRVLRDALNSRWSALAKYEMALCLLEQGKALEARGTFQSAGSAADNAATVNGGMTAELREVKLNARVGEGDTLVREKDYQRAAEFFRLLANNEDQALQAAGKAGEGEAIFLQYGEKKDLAQMRAAQIALAQACVIDTGAGEAAAKATYYLGRVLMTLGEADGQDFKNRAKNYFQIVDRSYPATRWAAAAKAELAK